MRYMQLIIIALSLVAVYLVTFVVFHGSSDAGNVNSLKIDRSNALRGIINKNKSVGTETKNVISVNVTRAIVHDFHETKINYEGLLGSSSNSSNNFRMIFNYKYDHYKLFGSNNKKRDKIDLILGMATDLDPSNFAIFAKSFREFNNDAAVIVFMNYPIVTKNLHIAKINNITLIEFKLGDVYPVYLRKYHPSTLRWILKYHLLFNEKLSLLSIINRVILIDIRDSMFQSNPFTALSISDNILHVVGEETRLPIGDCSWNRGWILDCFGEEMLQSLSMNPIICSGVTLGSVNVVSDYLYQMNNVLLGKRYGRFPSCERNGVDQGVHNVLVYANMLQVPVKVNYEQDLLVSHMQSSMNSNVLDFTDNVINLFMGIPISIVHQYDRWYKLQVYVAKKYIDWMDISDSTEVWNDANMCHKNYVFIPNRDMFFGQCDAGSYRAFTIATCCERCYNYRKLTNITCTGFAHSDGVCYFKKCGNDYVEEYYKDYQKLMAYIRAGVTNQKYNDLRLKLMFSEQKINDFGVLSIVDSGMLRLNTV